MKNIFYIIIFLIFATVVIFAGDYYYDVYHSNQNGNSSISGIKQVKTTKPQSDVTANKITINANRRLKNSPPHLQPGFDWSLPDYADEAKYSGLTTELDTTAQAVKNKFLIVLWNKTNPKKGEFDFSSFERDLKRIAPQRALVRLEVNSACEAPAWALKQLRQTSDKSLIFWDQTYLDTTRPFIQEFAKRYASNPQVIGVQLGLADGEFGKSKDSCNDYDNKDGWGEFWMSPPERQEAEQQFGFNPDVFQQATLANIDIYADAFGKYKFKLAFTNIGTLFTYGDGAEPYNQNLKTIANYVLEKGLGNRDGAIERWMSYTDKVYGMAFTTMSDGSCRLDFNEDFADRIKGRYWGTENEFYGDRGYVNASMGPYENSPYRFLITSLRTLQMRRNFMSISTSLDKIRHPDYKTQDFLTYLSLVLGKTIENTPDAFVLMGERYINPYRLADQMDADCVKKNKEKVSVRSFGRWLRESPQNTTVSNQPAIKIHMPESENYWYQGFYLPEGIDYEYFAREAKTFSFDVNDKLTQLRCNNGCDVEVKAIFKDTVKTSLSVEVAEGIFQGLQTAGDNKIKTATFTVKSSFAELAKDSDVLLKSQNGPIPLIMLRLNFL